MERDRRYNPLYDISFFKEPWKGFNSCKLETSGERDGIAIRITDQLLTIHPVARCIEADLMTLPETEPGAQGILRIEGRNLKGE